MSKKKATYVPVEPKPKDGNVFVHVMYTQDERGGQSRSKEMYSQRDDAHKTTTFRGALVGTLKDTERYYYSVRTFEAPKSAFDHPRGCIYAVVGYYRDGDTFGCSYGNMHIVDVFGNSQKAHAVASRLETDAKTDDSIYGSVKYPWGGYFASLERIEVVTLTVIGGPEAIGNPDDMPSW